MLKSLGNVWLIRGMFLLFLFFACKNNPTDANKNIIAIEIESEIFEIYSGGLIQFSAIGTTGDGQHIDLTSDATWINAPVLVGTIDGNGLFRAVNLVTGFETVFARYGEFVDSVQVTITKRASFFSILPRVNNLKAGRTLQCQAVAAYQDGSQAYVSDSATWTVSPGIAATVDSLGRLRSITGQSGVEIVKASYQSESATAEITIQENPASIFEIVTVPAGTFSMGSESGAENERPVHTVFLDPYEIGKYEVTNAQYATYLTEALHLDEIRYEDGFIFGKNAPHQYTMYTRINQPELGQAFILYTGTPGELGDFTVIAGYENYPVGRMTWYGAKAFCDFYGYRLPTEAEWERACRADQNLEYGTKDGTISADLANLRGISGADIYEEGAPVGSFPANPLGLFDMCGNVDEIVFDEWADDFYQNSPAANPIGPGQLLWTGLADDDIIIVRGGSWLRSANGSRSTARNIIDEPHDNVVVVEWAGFRVARSVN
ncbi:MAG: formylglycine-generating enzyme family protein [Calditrichaeota bacterium]|nr:MAG: formylglycine-generating enzyme family protein [Calditrichota bacterium]